MNKKYTDLFMTIRGDYAIYGYNYKVKEMCIQACDTGNVELNYKLALKIKEHSKDHAQVVIDNGSAEDIYYLALNVEEVDKQVCIDAIIQKGEPIYICKLAQKSKGKYVKECQDAIFQLGDPWYIYLFAKMVKEADSRACRMEIEKIGDQDTLLHFLKFVRNKGNFLNEIKSYYSEHGYDGHIKKTCEYIEATGDASLNYKMALIVKEHSLRHAEVVLESESAEYIYKTAKSLQGLNTKPYLDKLLWLNNPLYIQLAATHIKGADIKASQNLVIKSRNPRVICEFAKLVEGADRMACLDALWEIGNKIYLLEFIKYINPDGTKKTDYQRRQNSEHDSVDIPAYYKQAKEAYRRRMESLSSGAPLED